MNTSQAERREHRLRMRMEERRMAREALLALLVEALLALLVMAIWALVAANVVMFCFGGTTDEDLEAAEMARWEEMGIPVERW